MRLLNTTTKRLESFYGKNIPPYATLSHMWGQESEEVLFKHIAGSDDDIRDGESRKGYAKMVAACDQAFKDGYEYIWIDTCCIDKGSSAELSEAINSMYTWYKESEVCYAYLEDVRSGRNQGVETDQNATFEMVSFQSSRWFKRGWTLQELIAPPRVIFYSKEWVDIGTKATLQDTISDMTGIRVEMITGYNPKKASVAEIMSWAAFRETTREEDIAYCLMGLFGVHMPLLYGEGKRAFMRLQEEIMKISDDHSLFAWKSYYDYSGRTPKGWGSQGMLEDSPWNFRDAKNVVRSDDEDYSPYYLTNQGLQIKLPLRPLDIKEDHHLINLVGNQNVFKATLKCTYRDTKPTRWIVIYLEMVREGHYVRRFPHWLDETQINPSEAYLGQNGPSLTSLLVMQVDTLMNSNSPATMDVRVKISPTESGFTFEDHSLAGGYEYTSHGYVRTEILVFARAGKQFVVVTGNDDGIPWLDVIGEIGSHKTTPWWINNIRSSYNKGSRRNIVSRHCDRLSIEIAEDWSVNVSVKLTHRRSLLEAVIDIQKLVKQSILAFPEGVSDTGTLTSTSGGSFPLHPVDLYSVPPGFMKEGSDWLATFNPKMKRTLDVSLVHSFMHEREVYCVRFSPDGKYLATGSSHIVQIYDVKTGNEIWKAEYPKIYGMCFSPDGKSIAIGTKDKNIRICGITEKFHHVFSGHQGRINSVKFSPDGRLVVSGSKDGTVRIWKIADGTSQVLTVNSLYKNTEVTSVSLSPNGQFVAAGSKDSLIWIWDIATTRLVEKLQGHQSGVNSIAFAPDGKALVSGSEDRTLRNWDISKLTNGGVKSETGSANGSGFSSGLVKKGVDKPGHSMPNFIEHTDRVSSVAISHDGKWAVSGSDKHSVLFWNLRNMTARFLLHGHRHSVTSVDLSPTSNIFATSSYDQDVRIWSYTTI